MDPMESIKQTFYQECEDLLGDLESGLIDMDNGSDDLETVNAVFRAVHSIKGGAGAFNLTDLVDFAHIFENVLDDIRSDRLDPDDSTHNLLLQSSDMLSDLVMAARDDGDFNQDRYDKLLGELRVLSTKDSDEAPAADTGDNSAETTDAEDYGFEPLTLDFGLGGDAEETSFDAGLDAGKKIYDIRFAPHPGLSANGHSVTRLVRELCSLGDADVSCDLEALPDFGTFEPDETFLTWSIVLTTDSDHSDISEVFEFAEDDCELQIIKRTAEKQSLDPVVDGQGKQDASAQLAAFGLPDLSDLPPLGSEASSPEPSLAELLSQGVPASTETPSEPKTDDKPANQAAQAAQAKVEPEKAPPAKKPKKKAPKSATATIRVSLERIDRLINQVGELVINQAMLNECVMESDAAREPSVISGLDEFKQLTRDLQESVMAIRAQPVQPLFQRMSRIVREAADATNKTARLVLEGEFTEVDKTIVEKLADPLTHMIRNAIDHGLEMPEERLAKGKPAEGIIKLSAAHRSGKIVIEVSDDGGGINRERVKKIAIEKGLISTDTVLTDSEIDNLLFMAGFSTVEKVSTLSGRGVGMDVVKRAIQSIGGRITISSEPDKGSTFTINLPLTLAVLDGMLVQVCGQTLVVPLTAIVETLLPVPNDIHKTGPHSSVVNIRGKFVPLIYLGEKLKFANESAKVSNNVILSVETEDGSQCALMVDKIQDQRQVVIKSLEDNYGDVQCIAAATILGDGRIALILDVDEVVSTSKPARVPPPTPEAVSELAHAS